MPSPTSSTCPTSRVSTFRSYSEIRLVMTLRISLALIPRGIAAGSVKQECAESLEAGSGGRVDDPVTDLDNHPAEDVRVHANAENRLLVQHSGQSFGQGRALFIGEFRGGRYL